MTDELGRNPYYKIDGTSHKLIAMLMLFDSEVSVQTGLLTSSTSIPVPPSPGAGESVYWNAVTETWYLQSDYDTGALNNTLSQTKDFQLSAFRSVVDERDDALLDYNGDQFFATIGERTNWKKYHDQLSNGIPIGVTYITNASGTGDHVIDLALVDGLLTSWEFRHFMNNSLSLPLRSEVIAATTVSEVLDVIWQEGPNELWAVASWDTTSVTANGTSTATLSGLPSRSVVIVVPIDNFTGLPINNGVKWQAIEVTDGSFEFATTEPGVYQVIAWSRTYYPYPELITAS